jgi:hypothetical protein
MVIRYNWCEITSITKVPESQLILIFALCVGLNKPLSGSLDLLKKKLFLDAIPSTLINYGYIGIHRTGIFSHYKTIEPQSYIRDCSFLHMRFSAKHKSDYLYILSQRSIINENNWIPEHYVEPQYHTNPLIRKIKDKIIFPLEN